MLELSEHLAARIRAALDRCLREHAIERLVAADANLWGEHHAQDVAQRLGWVDSLAAAREILPRLQQMRAQAIAHGLTRVVLCGMGGSSLAPEVMCRNEGVELLILDSSHPKMVQAALADLEHTVVVVSSKSGSTLETESHLHTFIAAFESAGLRVAEHIVVVTDPGSEFDALATSQEIPVFHGDPQVGGRYSALTAFGLVPSALAGVDVSRMLDEAKTMLLALHQPNDTNPALLLGSAMAVACEAGLGVLAIDDQQHQGLGDWIEQLVAESLGKEAQGLLPIMVANGKTFVPTSGLRTSLASDSVPSEGLSVTIDEPLGAQFLLWEYATAIAGFLIAVDPFDQPNVEASKNATRSVLVDYQPASRPDFVDGGIRGWGTRGPDLTSAIDQVISGLDAEGYIALCCYLDRWTLHGIENVSTELSDRIQRPVSFGWGPRYLHSTGQFHKGGPQTGSFIHVSARTDVDLPVVHQNFTWGQLLESQVRGDARVLRGMGRTVLRLELSDLQEDLPRLLAALRG